MRRLDTRHGRGGAVGCRSDRRNRYPLGGPPAGRPLRGRCGPGRGTLAFVDGQGETIPALRDAHLTKQIAGPFLYYVPDAKVLGGSVGNGAMLPAGNQCGRLAVGERTRCTTAVGDLYIEADWSRSFGTPRPSKFAGAYPILEGLTLLVGLGVVLPTGQFDASHPTEQAVSIGNNIWDFAPTVAFTYTSPPILAEGTEVSAKFYWNNYLENPITHYSSGDLLNLDFAVTERIGRFQVGAAGVYVIQIENDKFFGVPVAPDGRRLEGLQLGSIVAYDMPEADTSIKLKANTTLWAENTVRFWSVVIGWVKKF